MDRTQDFRKQDCSRIFVALTGKNQCSPVRVNTIASWIKSTVHRAYEHMGRDSPTVKAHSVRGVATSLALAKGLCIQDICRAATWSSGHVFVKHYKMDVLPTIASSISIVVLQAGLR